MMQKRTRSRIIQMILIAACAGMGLPAFAGNATTVQSAPAASLKPLTGIADIRSLIQATESSTMETALRDKALGMYREALAFMEEASQWSERYSDLKDIIAKSPKELKIIRKHLETITVHQSPSIPPEADVEDMTRQLSDLENELEQALADARQAEDDLKKRSAVITDNPKQLARIIGEIERLSAGTGALKAERQTPEIEQADHARNEARLQLLKMQKNVLEAELAYFEENGEFLIARRDFSARQTDHLEKKVRDFRAILGERRQADASADARKARETSLRSAGRHPVIHVLADRNVALAEERSLLPARIQETRNKLNILNQQVARISSDLALTRDQVSAVRFSQSVGMLLRAQRAGLPDLRVHQRERNIRQTAISEAQIRVVELLGRLQPGTLQDEFREMLSRHGIADLDAMPEIKNELVSLWDIHREMIYNLWEDYNRYLKILVDLDVRQGMLIDSSRQYARFINEHILWTQSRRPLRMDDFSHSLQALVRLTDIRRWVRIPQTLLDLSINEYLYMAAAVILFLTLLYVKTSIHERLESVCHAEASCPGPFTDTLRSLGYSFLLALPLPLLIAALGRILSGADNPDDPFFVTACGSAMFSVSGAWMALLFIRHVIRRKGVGGSHFNWHPEALQRMRRALLMLIAVGLPIFFVWLLIDDLPLDPVNESLSIFVFAMGMLTIATFLSRLLHPHRGAAHLYIDRMSDKSLYRWRWIWFAVAVGLPVFLLVLSIAGYAFTAVHLAKKLLISLGVLVSGGLIHAVVMRWLTVMNYKISDAGMENRDVSEARLQLAASDVSAEGEPPAPAVDAVVNLPRISLQTRKLLGTILFLAIAAALWFIWAAEMPALAFFRQFQIGIGSMTLADLGLTVLTIFITIVATRNIPGLLEIGILPYLPLEAGLRYAIITVSRYIIVIIGVTTAFSIAGMRWTQIQWIVAAMTVGLGFGLQEIFSNFMSGLIILFERPIRVGDTVTIGGVTGTVTRIRIRATTILDWDRKELVIPNKDFVTGEIINWSLSDPVLRLVMPVGVAYGADTRKTRDILMDIARSEPHVLRDPDPRAFFIKFGDNSLDFELRVYVKGLEDLVQARHAILTEIHDRFNQAGIEIAFPQRDLHLRSIDDEVVASLRSGPGEKPLPAADPVDISSTDDLLHPSER